MLDNPFKDAWDDLFYADPDPQCKRLREFRVWLRRNRTEEITLFHGTAAAHKVQEQGLLPTTRGPTRRRSLQSAPGYVYLSVYPGMAKVFGEAAYPGKPVVVYAVTVLVKNLRTDKDQLRNIRLFAGRQGLVDCLAHSLVYGRGARVRGRVEPYRIKLTDTR